MSHIFYIKNTQVPKVMSPEELLNLAGENFAQFTIDEDDEEFDEIIQTPLDRFNFMILGQENISGRGFECSYSEEEHTYNVRVFTPSTSADWHGALSFIEKLATTFGVVVTDEEGETYEGNNITYDFRHDIAFGIASMEKGDEGYFIFGAMRPICFSDKDIDRILAAEDKVKTFDDFIAAQRQYEDLYIANPIFAKNHQDEIIGIYALTKTVHSVLPYKYPPFIDITKYNLSQEDIKEWRVHFADYDERFSGEDQFPTIGEIDYQTFLERLPEEKIQKLDGHYMCLCLETKAEIEALLGKKTGLWDKIKKLF